MNYYINNDTNELDDANEEDSDDEELDAELAADEEEDSDDDDEFDAEEYERILACRRRAARLLGYRPMSSGELRRKLIMKGERSDDADDAVEFLRDEGYLDDEQYAVDVALHYHSKGYNEWRVKMELRRHLVERDLWDDALAAIPDDEDDDDDE